MDKEDSNRRGFFKRIAKLGAASGIATLLFGRLTETIIPPVQAAGLNIDAVNNGTGTTQLNSSVSLGPAFAGRAATSTGSTTGVYGQSDSISGKGLEGWATAATGYTFGVLGLSASTNGIGVKGQAGNAGAKPIVAQGAPSQTASLQEWQNSAGTALSAINKDGWMGVGTSSPARSIHLVGNQACFRMDRNVNSSAFILVRASPDFSSIWKTFYVGVDASGVDDGSFFIGDVGTNVSGPSAVRLVIDNNGNIVPPSDNTGNIGIDGRRWALIRGVNVQSGDFTFENEFRLTEDGENGVALYNKKNVKIAIFDQDGNLHIKGKVMEDL